MLDFEFSLSLALSHSMYVSDDTHWVLLNTHHSHFYDFRTGVQQLKKRKKVSTYTSSSTGDEDRRVGCPQLS